ncbi:HET-domain-containing protein, partial [Trematosphaeria pertusa]
HVSLSYCWGSTGQHIRWITTRERLPEFEKVIPHEVLPKTIADAVKVVREIGIRYLWVDSLCIVQDDPDDWAYEAYRMAQVYNSSLFTVISGSDSAMGGLFLPREQLKVSAADILLQSNPEAGEHVATLYPSVQDIGTAHHGGPTTRRAWCYQEELLSPRRLYFTNRQFVWECLCSSHDETGSRSPGDTRSTKYCPPPYDADVLLRNTRVVGEWHSVIEEYTSRQLTYHSDVFAALAGVAASLKARYRCKYLAGMWEDDMLNGLLWQRAGTSLGRSAELNTPSWSWLSVQG